MQKQVLVGIYGNGNHSDSKLSWDLQFNLFQFPTLWHKDYLSCLSLCTKKFANDLYGEAEFNLCHDLYLEFTYGESVDVIEVINNSPLFIYARHSEDELESYQQLNFDLKSEKPKLPEYIYNEYSISKYCNKCGFYSSEPWVRLKDDVLNYLYDGLCEFFQGLREDIPIDL